MTYHHSPRVPDPNFPIIAITFIGILVITFLLVSYDVFVFKCCLNWRQVDVISQFSVSQGKHRDPPLLVNSPPRVQVRGLDEAVIRLIPVCSFKQGSWGRWKRQNKRVWREEVVRVRDLPQRVPGRREAQGHPVDCIDIWPQNNANCPLCCASISSTILFPVNTTLTSSPSQEEPIRSPDTMTGDENFVVIELGGGNHGCPFSPESSFCSISITPRDSPFGSEQKKESPSPNKGMRRMKLCKMTSMGDEFIIVMGGGQDEFTIQPMRRSILMDLLADRTLLLAVQEVLQQQKREIHEVEGCSSNSSNRNSEVWRSRPFFSFVHHGSPQEHRSAHLFSTLI